MRKINKKYLGILIVVLIFIGVLFILERSRLPNNSISHSDLREIYLESRFDEYVDTASRLRSNRYNDNDISNMVKCLFEYWMQYDNISFNDRVDALHVLKDPAQVEAVKQSLKNLDPLELRHFGELDIIVQDDFLFVIGYDRDGDMLRLYKMGYPLESRLDVLTYDQLSESFSQHLSDKIGERGVK